MNPLRQIVLYSKPGCHLCEEMKTEIAKANCADLYQMTEINIETDPALASRYRHDIPVLTINGVEAFKHRLSADSFRAYLLGARTSRPQ
jgi:glutaredoxin